MRLLVARGRVVTINGCSYPASSKAALDAAYRAVGRLTMPLVDSFFLNAIPRPPSLNNLFVNDDSTRGRKGSTRYMRWRHEADTLVMIGGGRRVDGPVRVHIVVEDEAGAGDLDNYLKALMDMLVRTGVIEGDDRKIVRKIVAEWAPIEGCNILVERHQG